MVVANRFYAKGTIAEIFFGPQTSSQVKILRHNVNYELIILGLSH